MTRKEMLQSVEMLAVCFRTHSGSGTDCDVRDKKAIDVAAVRAAIDALFAERDALTRQMALRRELQSETDADLAALREAVRCADEMRARARIDYGIAVECRLCGSTTGVHALVYEIATRTNGGCTCPCATYDAARAKVATASDTPPHPRHSRPAIRTSVVLARAAGSPCPKAVATSTPIGVTPARK